MIVRVDELVCTPTHNTPGFHWDSSWRIAILTDSTDYQMLCGKGERGAYTLRMSRQKCDWKMAVGDFISHAEAENKNAILVMSAEELIEAKQNYQGHACNDLFLRPNEPKVLIHSTPLDSWEKIKHDGCLKSWNKVKQALQTTEDRPIGCALGDPEDFSNYIMFGSGITGEIVVSSKQAGRIVTDVDAPYQSGARLYFDAQKIAEAGLLIRDGTHIKVKDCLPLSSYLIWAATWETIGLPDRITTPKLFADTADKLFYSQFNK